eukprot:m.129254 g.129254  ORF g.129254 m.129254 type:complete len:123 (+) comp22317_c0_seq2:1833-2201(+)
MPLVRRVIRRMLHALRSMRGQHAVELPEIPGPKPEKIGSNERGPDSNPVPHSGETAGVEESDEPALHSAASPTAGRFQVFSRDKHCDSPRPSRRSELAETGGCVDNTVGTEIIVRERGCVSL